MCGQKRTILGVGLFKADSGSYKQAFSKCLRGSTGMKARKRRRKFRVFAHYFREQ